MEVSRITTVILKGRKHLKVYGYDEAGELVKKVMPFTNYAYINERYAPKGMKRDKTLYKKYDDIFDSEEPLVKVYYDSIKPPKIIQDMAYQRDIPIELKFIMDNNLQFSRKRHIAYFDIETLYDKTDPDANMPAKSKSPITSIVFYSSLQQKYYILAWHPTEDLNTNEIKEDGDKLFVFCNNESEMIQTFCKLLEYLNVDILTGWNSHGYDVPYVLNRIKVLNLKCSISPINNDWMPKKSPNEQQYKIRIAGRDSIDMMDIVISMNYNLQNNKLDTAAREILGDEITKLKSSSWKDWQDNFGEFLKYAIRDVEILVKIDEKLQLFEYLIQMQIMSKIVYLNDINKKTKLIDSILLQMFWNKYIFPNNTKGTSRKFMGGFVLDPKELGVHKNMKVCDFASLYPTSIIAYNTSPETFIASEEILGKKGMESLIASLDESNVSYVDTGYNDELFGGRYLFLSQKERLGVIPEMSNILYSLRKETKKLYNTTTDPDKKLIYDKKQYAIKIILNSIYGALANKYFRLMHMECADAITYFGRIALRKAMKTMSECGTVQYCDTDSVSSDTTIRYKLNQINNKGNDNDDILTSSIEELYHNMVKDIYITNDKRYIG